MLAVCKWQLTTEPNLPNTAATASARAVGGKPPTHSTALGASMLDLLSQLRLPAPPRALLGILERRLSTWLSLTYTALLLLSAGTCTHPAAAPAAAAQAQAVSDGSGTGQGQAANCAQLLHIGSHRQG